MAPRSPLANKAPVVHKPTPENDKWNGVYDFGGTLGNIGLMIFSHTIPFYLWLCVEFYGGSMVYPGHPAVAQQAAALGSENMFVQMWNAVAANAAPTTFTFGVFSAFLFFEWFVAATLPGVTTIGLPVPSENNYQYKYLCNAVSGWYALLVLLATLHYTDVLPLQVWRLYFPSFMSCAIIWADALAVIIYVYGVVSGWSCRMSGNVLHDFFMGSIINPRLPGDVDLKMFAEIRNSWSLLFILAVSSCAQLYTETGVITPNFIFLLTCYGIYTNACQKGEECIVTSWDIAHEKFGWMLIYWNFAGVPFVYASIALYQHKIVGANPALQWGGWQLGLLYATLLAAYYVFDTANAQKNRFRMVRAGVSMDVIRRKTFPALPWAYIENPKTITGPGGRELLVDGWFKYARKIHYTADIVMTFLWGASCGFDGGLLPFFYFIFFFGMINHREARDFAKCKAKYGEMWDRYTALVPNAFIPTFVGTISAQKRS